MTQNIKILAIAEQIIFAWIYATGTNFCTKKNCVANGYISFLLILLALGIFDWYFLKLYPKFKKIPSNIFTFIILAFPILFYLCCLILNMLTKRTLSVIVIGALIAVISRTLWMYLARGKFSLKITEYLALKSLFLLITSAIFLIANLNFAISSYLKYINPSNDVYITENRGLKSNFLNYKFR